MNIEYVSPLLLFQEIGDYLSSTIPIDTSDLVNELSNINELQFRLAKTIKDTVYILNTRRMAVKQPKDKYITDLDREVEIKGATAQIQADYDFLLTLQIIIADRLDTAKIWLKS